MKYKARNGGKLKDKDAQIIGKYFEGMGKEITTTKIVEVAQSPKSEIHNYFEWDNTIAGNLYRLQQARNLMENIVVNVTIEGKQVEQRAWFSVRVEKGNAYVPIKVAIEVQDYRKQLLDKAITILENLTITMKMFREHQ